MANLPPDRIDALGQAGMSALSRGDAPLARQHFEAIVAGGGADASVWLAIGLACQAMDDAAGLSRALDQVLVFEPQNLRALLMKGDLLAASGDRRAAISFYNLVVGLVPDTTGLPPEIAGEITRVRKALEILNSGVYRDLEAHLGRKGYDPAKASPRFRESLDLLAGRKTRYVSQPRAFFYPELPNIQFFPRDLFPWMERLEAATDDICAELAQVMALPGAFQPYIEAEANRPTDPSDSLLDNQDWSACYIWRNGHVVPEIAELCPKTLAALEGIELETVADRAPFILFSKLAPGARIEPHHGFQNTRLVAHLPLIVPPNCRFRVGNEERVWEKGKAWVFDDTIEHEAHNGSDETRVILIFNIWRPELSSEERGLIASLMEGIDTL